VRPLHTEKHRLIAPGKEAHTALLIFMGGEEDAPSFRREGKEAGEAREGLVAFQPRRFVDHSVEGKGEGLGGRASVTVRNIWVACQATPEGVEFRLRDAPTTHAVSYKTTCAMAQKEGEASEATGVLPPLQGGDVLRKEGCLGVQGVLLVSPNESLLLTRGESAEGMVGERGGRELGVLVALMGAGVEDNVDLVARDRRVRGGMEGRELPDFLVEAVGSGNKCEPEVGVGGVDRGSDAVYAEILGPSAQVSMGNAWVCADSASCLR